MEFWRRLTGLAALVCAAAALNLLFQTQDFFTWPVLAPMGAGMALGAAWVILLLVSLAGRGVLEGRAVGGLNAVVASAVFLGICAVAYLFLQSWDASWDLTSEGRRELSPMTRQVLANINQQVDVTCFFLQVDDELVLIARDKTLRFLDQCKKHTSHIKVEVLDPTVDRARLEAMHITHASTQGTVVVRAGGRQRVITLSGGSPRLEEREFTNSLINVLRDTQPKVCFLTGHKERDIMDEDLQKGGSMFGNLLRGEAYAVERTAIKLTEPEVDKDCDVLIINNLGADLHPLEIEALDRFIDRGGRLLVLLDPWRGSAQGYGAGEQLRPWLEKRFGILVGNDIVITDKQSNIWQAELSVDGKPFENTDEGLMEYRGSFAVGSPVTQNFDQTMLLQAARSVRLSDKMPEGTAGIELLRTTPDYWAETDTERLLKTGQAKYDAGEKSGPVPLAAAAALKINKDASPKGRADARVVVVGDSDFMSNSQLEVSGHLNFALNTLAWMNESEELIAIRPTGVESAPLILSGAQRRAAAWVAIMLLPQLVAAAGAAVYFWRRRHQ